jgi:hypothetical protein
VFIGFACFGISAAAAGATLVACDNGGSTGGSGSGSPHTSTSNGPGSTGSSMTTSGGTPITCTNNYCMIGGSPGGYGFVYADGLPPKTPTGTSTAMLATDMTLCMSGHVMSLPASPSPADYMNDWGLGIGVNLNQMMGMGDGGGGTPMGFALTGTGITVTTSGVPMCTSARVVIDHGGMDYCATLTDGKEIPWSQFNQTCWMPTAAGALAGAPMDATQLKVQFVTSKAGPCDFTKFCLDDIKL